MGRIEKSQNNCLYILPINIIRARMAICKLPIEHLVTLPVVVLLLIPTLVTAGGSHVCYHDFECEWYEYYAGKYDYFGRADEPEGTNCCSDNRCHENCDWETFWFAMVFVILPIFVCFFCACVIGGIVYCAIKQANKSSHQPGVVYNNGNNGSMYTYPQMPPLPGYSSPKPSISPQSTALDEPATPAYTEPFEPAGAVGGADPLPQKDSGASNFGYDQMTE